MAVETKPHRPKNQISADLYGPPASKDDIRSLPATIEWLRREGLLLETDVEVDGDLELTGVQKHFDGSYPVLFNNVKGYPHARAITNLFANMDIVNRYFGWADGKERTKKLAHALTHPIPAEIVGQDEAPVQEEVITDDLEVNKWLMAIRHTVLESEITIGSGNSVVIGDYFHGGSHIGYNRMNFRWGNVGTFQPAPGGHMWQIMTEHYKDPKPVPFTMAFGVPVAATLLAGGGFDYAVLPRGGDEIGAAGAVQDVNIPFPMTDWGGCIIQLKKRNKWEDGWARNFLVAAMSCSQGMRLAIAVDSDIDIYNMDEIIWCLTTRVNPRTDILNPLFGGVGQTFIPEERLTAGDKDRKSTRLNSSHQI